jgi:hypothetical protein
MRSEPWKTSRRAALALAVALQLGVSGPAAAETPTFPTPETALDAFRKAVETDDDGTALLALFGPEHRDALIGGDPTEARIALAELRSGVKEGLRLTPDGDTRRVLHIGSDGWPMPIPLVQDGATWRFDTAEGIEEINDRRVGAHELEAIELCEAYVDAQMDYASEDRDGDEVLEYAQTILSPTGTKSGLYWPTAQGEEPSPLGEFVAKADAYRAHSRLGEPYRGYFFRVLTKQGPTPPGGAYDYVINGNMIAGFALLAWPADHGNSGVMSFLVNQQGKVYQKDLGPETAKRAAAITAYDPGEGWTLVED